MDTQKQIAMMKKQNEGMESSFKAKDIKYTKLDTDSDDPENELALLKDYNEYLKNISKQNRSPPPVKEEKPKEQPKPKPDDNEDDDDLIKEVKPVYSTITNMEDIKRAFFSKEYETSQQLIIQHPFKFYEVSYKYESDNNGRPGYVAKNLLRGFVQGLDNYRKYLMVCFRCVLINKERNEYAYPSYWIVNSNDDIKMMLGSLYDDYNFMEVEGYDDVKKMLKIMEKNEDENNDTLIGECYLH